MSAPKRTTAARTVQVKAMEAAVQRGVANEWLRNADPTDRAETDTPELVVDQLLHGLRCALERVTEQTARIAQIADSVLGTEPEQGNDDARPVYSGRLHEALALVREVNESITQLAQQVNRLNIL